MSRPRHPNKHIEAAVRAAEARGWVLRTPASHAWGRLYCPAGTRGGCLVSVWSTPRSPERHARSIAGEVAGCPHTPGGDADAGA